MHPRPFALAPIDQKLLLTFATLHLAPHARVSVPRIGQVLVRHDANRRPLVLSPLHWGVLKQFEGGRTTASVLKQLIHGRSCVPLGDFYELIVKAHRHGLLSSSAMAAEDAPVPEPVCAWRVALRGVIVRRVAVGCMVAMVLALLIHPPAAPAHWLWWIPGWLLAGLATGAGFALAACVLHGAGLEVRAPRFILKSALPRFETDLSDAEIAPPEVAINVALAQLVPPVAFLTLAATFAPDLALPLVAGLLFALAPLGASPLLELLRALHHEPRLSVAHDFQFEANRTFARRLRSALAPGELRFAFLRIGYAVVWTLLVGLAAGLASGADLRALLHDFFVLDVPARLGLALFLVFALGLLFFAGILARGFAGPLRRRLRPARPATSNEADTPTPPDAGEIFGFLGKTHPFELVPEEDRRALAAAFRALPFEAGELLVSEGERRRRLRLLFSGRVSVQSGPFNSTLNELHPGSIFAEHGLLRDEPAPHDVRATTAGSVLELEHDAFTRLVGRHVPERIIENSAGKVAFLRQIPLSRHWPQAIMASLARRAVIQTFDKHTRVIETGRENTLFFLVIDGELNALKDGRQVARLKRGDIFGEISLLQNSLTHADIVGHKPGRFFCVSKPDFLAFLTQDTAIALQIETIASRRLGHPVFSPPLPTLRHSRR